MCSPAQGYYLRGCYGAPSVFQHGSPTCNRCANFSACATEVRETLAHLAGQVDVSDLVIEHRNAMIEAGDALPMPAPAEVQAPLIERKDPARKVKYALSADQKAVVERLPKKAAKILDTLIRNGKLEAMLNQPQKGINPFRGGTPNWMEVTFDALIAGGFSKKELKELLMSRLQWGETTAFPHVTKAVAITTAVGVVREEAGRFVLARR